MKNWIGNKKSIFVTLGASNHVVEEREKNDYYATDPIEVKRLLLLENFNDNIYECAVGEGHIADVLKEHGKNVLVSDIIDRGYKDTIIRDFLKYDFDDVYDFDIITNPPYKFAKLFVEKSLEIIKIGNKVAMFLKLTFLESKNRYQLFKKFPPKYVYVYSKRAMCAKNGKFDLISSSAVAYAWFIWIKGYKGDTVIKWIPF